MLFYCVYAINVHMTADIFFTRHGAAEQEKRTPEEIAALEALPDDAFKQEIWDMNSRQGLTERGRRQAAELGKRIGRALLPNAAEIVAIVGPYARHIQTAEIALSTPELSDRRITVVHDPRLAERSRGRLDPSIWPARKLNALPPEHPYAIHATQKNQRPATWRPPQGENYNDVNLRVDAALAAHGILEGHTPTIAFSSGELSLARLRLPDEAYRQGTLTEQGDPMSLLTLNNGGVVALTDPHNIGRHTHWQVHDPAEVPRDQPYQTPDVMRSQLNRY